MPIGENSLNDAGEALTDAGDADEIEPADAGEAMGFDDFDVGLEDVRACRTVPNGDQRSRSAFAGIMTYGLGPSWASARSVEWNDAQMESLLSDLGQFIQANQAWALPIVLLICLGESLVLVGLFIPATAIMLLIGGLAGAGVLDPAPIVIGAILGAILGDIVSYVVGRWLGPGVVHRKPLRRYRHAIARTRLFFRKYGFAAVFIGRFLGPIRSTVPLVAGMMAMSQMRFQIANVLSAVFWAPLMLAPGYLGARGAGEVGAMTGERSLGILALVIVVTVVATVLGGRRFFTSSRPRRVRVQSNR